MSNQVFNEVVGTKHYGDETAEVRLTVEQHDEAGFTWKLWDDCYAENCGDGFAPQKAQAIFAGKAAAAWWCNASRETPFNPEAAETSFELEDMSSAAYQLVDEIKSFCQQKQQLPPFWLDFVSALDDQLDDIMAGLDDEDDPFEDEEIEDDSDDDGEPSEDYEYYGSEGD